MVTIKTAIQQGKSLWESQPDLHGIEAVMCHILACSKEDLMKDPDRVLSDVENCLFVESIELLRAGKPLSYIINKKEFFELDFFVDNRVLTPRPETELLVELSAEIIQKNGLKTALDIGTGSGCIAVSLLKNIDGLKMTASDLSADALEVARINAKTHDVFDRISFINTNLLSGIDNHHDLVAANLPYIGSEKYNFISADVKTHEPEIALFGGFDGLRLYEQLFLQIKNLSWRPKYVLGEFGFLQSNDLKEMIESCFPKIKYEIVKDLSSIDRVFVITF
jgi:release factor glutamine methyltransferase